jgi:dUTP pyrophosphatase
MLANGIGIIDADYYNNPDNEGHIYFQVFNISPFNLMIKKGEVIGQGTIVPYGVTENDNAKGERLGGFGSTSLQFNLPQEAEEEL